MAKVFIEESTLTAIGDAIREKEGTAELVPVTDMATRISAIQSGGGGDFPEIVLTDSATYACAGPLASATLQQFPNKVSTKDLTELSYMFYRSTLETVPFTINIKDNVYSVRSNSMFAQAAQLRKSPDIIYKTLTSYSDMSFLFSSCTLLEELGAFKNAYPENIGSFFAYCYRLRAIPDDFFSTWNFSRLKTYSFSSVDSVFSNCKSLRKIPSSFFDWWSDGNVKTNYSYTPYSYAFCECATLDEVINMPVITSATYTSNMFNKSFQNAGRLKAFTFKTNEDGSSIVAQW
jgi:hypothetical protein